MDNKITIEELEKMNGEEFAGVAVAVLMRLRKIYHGEPETQDHINYILTKLYNILY